MITLTQLTVKAGQDYTKSGQTLPLTGVKFIIEPDEIITIDEGFQYNIINFIQIEGSVTINGILNII